MKIICVFLASLVLLLPVSADDAAVDALVAQLSAEDASKRDEAEKKLVEMGAAAEARLRDREKTADPETQERIRRALLGIEAGKIASTDFESIRTINVGHAGVTGIAWTPDGKKLVSCGGWADFRIWDATTGKQLAQFKAAEGYVPGIAFAGDPNRLWISGDKVICWDLAQGKAIKEFEGGGHTSVFVSPDRAKIMVLSTEGADVRRVTRNERK